MDSAERRFDLLALVMNAESARSRGPGKRSRIACLCRESCDHLTRQSNDDSLDREWVTRELEKVKAAPGEFPDEVYERWRLRGMPMWAAIAAGMTPTPGSRLFIGRRPDLP